MTAARATAPSYNILGRTVTLPVQVRRAAQWSAQYLVPAAAAQRLVEPAGLEVARPVPGRAMLALSFIRYDDSDLDAYHEVAVSLVVRPHDAPPASALRQPLDVVRGRLAVYIHRLPVDQEFTLEAGRTIWGYPKVLGRIDIDPQLNESSMRMELDGRHAFSLTVRAGGSLRLQTPPLPTYTYQDGVLRRTTWVTRGEGLGGRVGGARLVLGDHPVADELRELGLPRRALMTASVERVTATFGPAEVIRSTRE